MPDPYPDVAALLAHLNELFPALGTAVTDADEARRLFAALRRPVAQPTPVRAVTETVAAPLVMPTEFVAQNGTEIHESTPIDVTGCTRTVHPKQAKHRKHHHKKTRMKK